ncbi:MAG TPA: hypothetical protein VK966_09890, partial [Longimicrobiales bacterium]|nr:hypothetical protein [Longimicrobiales bacterium]
EDWLLNMWRMGRDAVQAGQAGGPFAYVVPPDQRHPREAVEMVNVLRRGGVEVHRATRSFRAGDVTYPAGSYVALASQPFRPHLMDLLEPQEYPDMRLYPDGPPDPPYDISGWTLPVQMGVRTDRIDEPFQVDGLEPVDKATVWAGDVRDNARWGWALSPASNAAALAANRLLAHGAAVGIAAAATDAVEAGAYLVPAGSGVEAAVRELAADLGVTFAGLRSEPAVEALPMNAPRVGLYKSWRANMDEGWTRWVLEQYEFPVDTLHDADIRERDLSVYDAIIVPDQGASAILHGYASGTRPEEITGGMGLDGVVQLRDYARQGGRIIAFDGATELFIQQFGLPVRNVVSELPPEDFFIPGTLIRLAVDTTHALAAGMPGDAAASFVRSTAFSVPDDAEADVVARYADEDLVLSGWALGEDRYLAGRAAVVRVPQGAGDVVLFGFRPQFRAQPRNTFKLLFNAIHGAAVREPVAGVPASAGGR